MTSKYKIGLVHTMASCGRGREQLRSL